MKLFTVSFFVGLNALFTATRAIPTAKADIQERSTAICGQWDSLTEGQYIIYNDLWGESSATSGSQCTTFNSISGTTIAWSTSWTWAGGSSSVKSYAQVYYSVETTLSSISTLPTKWAWSYTGSSIVADVSYDMWLGTTATGTSSYEIMVWLDAIGGAGPISSTGSTISTPSIGGVTWKLYSGPNGSTTVYSFVASSAQSNFSGDLMQFFTYLVENEGVSSSLYLQSIAAGTEPFTGTSAVFTTSSYSVTKT